MSPEERITKLAKRLQAEIKSAALAEYRKDQQCRTDLYSGEYFDHILAELKTRLPESWQDLIPLWLNVYRKVTDERAAGLYRAPPVRVLIGPDGADVPESEAMIDAVIDRKTLNAKLDKAARYMEAHRTILIAVVWRHNRVELDILTPPLFHVVPGEPDPTSLADAEAVAVHMAAHAPASGDSDDQARTLVWYRADDGNPDDVGGYAMIGDKKGEVFENEPNPYAEPGDLPDTWRPVLPFTLLQAEDPDGDLYISGGDDLVRAALHVGFTLTDNEFIERFQSYGQPVFNGVGKEVVETMKIGPNDALALGAVGQESFEFKAPPQTSANRLQSLQTFLRMLCYMYDLPVDTFDESRLPTSGVAMRISRKKLGQYRSDLAERMASIEESLFRTMRAVRNAWVPESERTPWNYTYRVTPVDQGVPLDLLEQDQRQSGRIAVGLDSVVEILAKERGISEDQARIVLAQNLADNAPILSGVGRLGSAVPASAPAAGGAAFELAVTSKAAGAEGPVKRGFAAALRERLAARDAQANNGNGGGA